MNTLKYKGYIGSVAYSETNKVFFGKLEGIDDLVNYEGESVQELTSAFHEAVEDYLIFCEEHNCKPEKSYSGAFNVRVAPSLHRDIANLAAEAGVSINAFVKRALAEAVKHPWGEPGPLVTGYGVEQAEPAILMDSGSQSRYGARDVFKLAVPHKDAELAKELAGRMGWDLSHEH